MADFSGTDLWREEDADWERLQRKGLAYLAKRDIAEASKRFAKALQLARRHFQPGDPRLATSLSNQALLLAFRDDPVASTLFEEALSHWKQGEAWLALQPRPPRRARSSLFHLRLEAKHPGAYGDRRDRQDRALLAKGREITEALAAKDHRERGDGWQPASSPDAKQGFGSHRKITVAVQLIAQPSSVSGKLA